MSEVWTPESFVDRPYARKYFQEIVKWSAQNHPFYKQHIQNYSENVPVLTRDVVADNNDSLLNGWEETGKTSGSTGIPVRLSWSKIKFQREQLSDTQFIQWIGGLLPRVRLVGQRECAGAPDALDVCSPLPDQIEFIKNRKQINNVKALITYPSNAANLSVFIIENKIDFAFIERVVCYAECIDQTHLELIKQAFPNARIWSTYSCSEVGLIAATCPFESDYQHIMAQNMGVELLNKEGMPVEHGEVGQIVVTDFFNRNMPLIRYALGDLAIAGVCPCGRLNTPAFKTVLGKVRGALKRNDGTPIMFANIAVTLRDLPGLRQYQIIQEQLKMFHFRYVLQDGYDDIKVQFQIKKALSDFLLSEPEITFSKENYIERDANGKFYASICKV